MRFTSRRDIDLPSSAPFPTFYTRHLTEGPASAAAEWRQTVAHGASRGTRDRLRAPGQIEPWRGDRNGLRSGYPYSCQTSAAPMGLKRRRAEGLGLAVLNPHG